MNQKINVIQLGEFGDPADVLKLCREELPECGLNQVRVKVLASPINPADINVINGRYEIIPNLPCIPGNEGVGVVTEVGSAVDDTGIGQIVIAAARMGWWCDAFICDPGCLVVLPETIDRLQSAMLAVNPPTAWQLLHQFVDLKPGDGIIQNAANSAVGRCVIQIARACGLKSINLVRRKALIPELESIGADIVAINSDKFSKDIRGRVGKSNVKLGLNAVGGTRVAEMVRVLGNGATLVTYGAMAREPVTASNAAMIFRDIRFCGFWMTEWYRQADSAMKKNLFQKLIPLVRDRKLIVPVEETYRLTDIQQALQHATRERRSGKILLTPGIE